MTATPARRASGGGVWIGGAAALAAAAGCALLVAASDPFGFEHDPGRASARALAALFTGALVWLFLARRRPRRTTATPETADAAEAAAPPESLRATAAATDDLRRRLEEAECRAAELRSLTELGQLLQACDDEREAHTVAAHGASRLFPQLSGALYLLGEDRRMAERAAAWGPLGDTHPGTITLGACWALRRGRLHHADGATQLRCEHVDARATAHACLPVHAHGENLGVLTLWATDPAALARVLEPSRQIVLTALAEQTGLAVANLRLRETLRALALRDPLTGLYNRRFVDEWLDRELQRALRNGESVSVLMMDIDHFKRFNDTHGHDGGDAALRDVGALLLGTIRASDVACRLGGEEFALLLPGTASGGAETLAEKLRAAAEELAIPCRGPALGRLTLSIGVATFPEAGATADDVLHAADQALYRAKAQGRNCVRTAALMQRGSPA